VRGGPEGEATNAAVATCVGAAVAPGGIGLGTAALREPGVPETTAGMPLAIIWAGRAGAGAPGTAGDFDCCVGGA